MPLDTTKEMFRKAYEGGYAIGAFNVNNMEIVQAITEAAQLAAYYSETGDGQNIPVDMTQVRQVKKIPGGKPGMVIYHTYKTVIANPSPDIVVDALNAEKKE